MSVRITLAALALSVAACTPAPAPTTQTATQTVADLGLRQHAGERYMDFIEAAEMAHYTPGGLGLNEADQARLATAMAVQEPAILPQGGGAEALVFTGCAATSCQDGVSVVAIDTATGQAFVGVSDRTGAEVLVPNDRVLALLEVRSATGRWDGALRRAPAQAPAAP